jgi:hypothetical protein
MDFAIFERGDLDSALSMAEDVDSRLGQADRMLGHLQTIKTRGQEELNALLLTGSIEAAKANVAELETQLYQLDAEIEEIDLGDSGPEPSIVAGDEDRLTRLRAQHERLDGEVRRLKQAISEASEEAARSVARRGSRERPGSGSPG